jgi:SlyX protein
MPARDDQSLEFQFDRRVSELESRSTFQEQAIAEMSDALAEARNDAARTHALLLRALRDLEQLRGELNADPADEPPPPHY